MQVFSWYLNSDSRVTWGPVMDPQALAFYSTTELDIVNFAGNFGFEICKFGHEWTALLNKARYSSLVLLLGAGGVVVYLLRKRRREERGGEREEDGTNQRVTSKSFVKWLFEEELVENFDDETDVVGRYFGPDPSSLEDRVSSGDADAENDSDDLSLNSLSNNLSPRRLLRRRSPRPERTPANISNPCPRCVKGTCRLKRHLASRASSTPSSSYSTSPKSRQPLKTSTPEIDDYVMQRPSAFSRLSSLYQRAGAVLRQQGDGQEKQTEEEADGQSSTPNSECSGRMLYRSRLGRGAPDGRELWSLSPVLRASPSLSPAHIPREDSMDSIAEPLSTLSISGSMRDMVTNARDVRRLIRAVSIDSQDSDYSLDFDLESEVGASTAEGLHQLTEGLSRLIDNCDSLEGEMDSIPGTSLVSSKSSMSGLSSLAAGTEDDMSLRRENSIPDLRRLKRASRGQQRGLWKLTNFSSFSERESMSEAGSLEWDSPQHGWHPVRETGDLEDQEDLSLGASVASLADPWQWDDEWAGQQSLDLGQLDGAPLPWTGQELDLESELRRRSLSSTSSVDLVRQPPSGRSSSASSMVEEPRCRQLPLNLVNSGRRSRVTSLKSPGLPSPYPKTIASPSSSCSEESGFHGSEALDTSFTSSMNSSSIFTSSINLSPVKEAREPGSPMVLSPESPMVFGDITTTDTVIKVVLPGQQPRRNPSLARGLFQAVETSED